MLPAAAGLGAGARAGSRGGQCPRPSASTAAARACSRQHPAFVAGDKCLQPWILRTVMVSQVLPQQQAH